MAYRCTSCGSIVTARGKAAATESNALIEQIFPDTYALDDVIPESARRYLLQAHKTLSAPDASVVMSASAIDAMLKHHGLKEGSLYSRIDEAVTNGLLTKIMSQWAHSVRLDANKPRHADAADPHLSTDDAERAFRFATALADYLFVIPSKMPKP